MIDDIIELLLIFLGVMIELCLCRRMCLFLEAAEVFTGKMLYHLQFTFKWTNQKVPHISMHKTNMKEYK